MVIDVQELACLRIPRTTPSVETGCFPYLFVNDRINSSAMSMALSFHIVTERICLFSGSIATQIHMYVEPILTRVSSIINSDILFLFLAIFLGLYF